MNQPVDPAPDSQNPLESIPNGMSHREYWKRFTQQAQEAAPSQPAAESQPPEPVPTAPALEEYQPEAPVPVVPQRVQAPEPPPQPAVEASPQPVTRVEAPPVQRSRPHRQADAVQPVQPAPEDPMLQQAQLIQQNQFVQQTQITQLALQAQLTQQVLLNQLTQQVQSNQLAQQTSKEEKSGMENTGSTEGQNSSEPEQLSPRKSRKQKFSLRDLRFGPPFWTITGLLSLIVNVVLIVVLISLASQIFTLKATLTDQLLGGLYNNFLAMDQAHIRTSIPVSTNVPAKFDLVLNTETTVILTKATLIKGAKVASLVSGGMSIYNAPADIVLPVGTQLPIQLNLTVPVDQQIPVNLTVNVDIPLNQTDLHAPFTGLQNVVLPYYQMLKSAPNTLQETVCGKDPSDLCSLIVP